MPITTLIAAETATSGLISDVCDRLSEAGCDPAEINWLEPGKAVDIGFSGELENAKKALAGLLDEFDICVQASGHRRKKLLISDMDSTMITVECIDELADYAGIKAQIAEITERAMQGELDFAQALRERVKLLAGLDELVVAQCLDERVRLMPGAKALVQTMAGWGAHTILVSGGFTHFAEPVAKAIGFAEVKANVLGFAQGKLTGEVEGEIVDARVKQELLIKATRQQSVELANTIAVGDGANDIPMIQMAGLGAAYHAKPKAEGAADFAIRHNDLTALLYAQGIRRSEWVNVA